MKPVTVHIGTVIREEWIVDGVDGSGVPVLELLVQFKGVGDDSALLTALGKPIVLSRSVDELMGSITDQRQVVDAALALVAEWKRLGLVQFLNAGQHVELVRAVDALEGK